MLEYGDLRLETDTFQLSCGERSVRLSRKEFDMLELLMRSREMVLTKENLILKLWGYESDAEDNNVEVYISFLRKKLDHLHSKVKDPYHPHGGLPVGAGNLTIRLFHSFFNIFHRLFDKGRHLS